MRKFERQKSSGNAPPDITLDFGAAAAKVPRTFEPGEYKLRVQSARVIQRNENVLIALDLVETESGGRVDGLPLWVDGPNAGAGDLTAKNQHVIAQLLTLAGLPTAGNVGTLIPKLAGLEFDARLALAVDGRSRPYPQRASGNFCFCGCTMTLVVPFTFAAVARQLAEHRWRPFPGLQTSKVPAMQGWSGLNLYAWDDTDLVAAVADYQPAEDYACCLAAQSQIVAIDADIVDPEHAAYADKLADDILGATPLLRIGLAPKCIRIYRAGNLIRSRKLHPLEIFCGSGQFIAFGWHAKAGRPYIWPRESPLTISTDSHDIPSVTRAKIEHFTTELFKVVPRRLLPTRQGRPGGSGSSQTVGERLRMLAMLHGSWKRAAAIVLGEACEGYFNETLWAVVTSAAGRGIPEDVVWKLFENHFRGDPKVSEAKVVSDLVSMMERARRKPRQRSAMTFTPVTAGGGNDR